MPDDSFAHPPRRALVNAALGAWMIVAAFVLPRTDASQTACWLTGALVVTAALASVRQPRARFGVAALAGWWFFSALVIFFTAAGTLVHDMFLSFALFSVALVPFEAGRHGRRLTPSPSR